MSRGISLHIGLNHVDTAAYPGYIIPTLSGCINDANAMSNIAQSVGFTTRDMLIDGNATALNVKNKITSAASQLCDGDFFLLTYSGHGSQIPDETGQEEDGLNETWILYDRQFIDDELYALWPLFKQGVRIFVLSDSCHSGTMVKMLLLDIMAQKRASRDISKDGTGGLQLSDVNSIVNEIDKKRRSRGVVLKTTAKKSFPEVIALSNYIQNKELYQNIQMLTKATKDTTTINASLIYISGCQDNQTSGDGATNGVFTGNLLNVWNKGSFSSDYKNFYDRILSLMPSDQTPNYMTLGINLPPFEAQKPFTVISSTTVSTGTTTTTSSVKPTIDGPVTWDRSNLPPTFNVNKGSNPYYYIEVTTDCKFFNYNQNGSQRSDSNFYATWNDSSINYKLYSDNQYTLPQSVWDQLKNADKLYYRVGSTMDSNWNGWMISVSDDQADSAPFVQVMAVETPQPATETPTPVESGSTDTSATDSSTSSSRIKDSVGQNGTNSASDVLIIQRLLSELSEQDGGTSNLSIDGKIGQQTIGAIKKFQRANDLNESGLFRPDKGSVIMLYIKSGIISITYTKQVRPEMMMV